MTSSGSTIKGDGGHLRVAHRGGPPRGAAHRGPLALAPAAGEDPFDPELPTTSGDPINNKAFMDALLPRLAAGQPTIQALAATQRAGIWNCPTQVIFTKLWDGQMLNYTNQLTKALQDAGAGLLLGTDGPALQGGYR
jgi:hypothetical protein